MTHPPGSPHAPSGSPHSRGLLSCPACGGPCSPSHRVCAYCGNHLATVRCSACSALHFAGALLCSRCGRQLRRPLAETHIDAMRCPRCSYELEASALGVLVAAECGRCGGLFVDVATLKQLVADREQARAVPLPPVSKPAPVTNEVRYLPCPACQRMMNRVNFGRRSGVIVDVCRDHGTWFDAGELMGALEFVAQGGLAEAMQREREELLEAQRQARQAVRDRDAARDWKTDTGRVRLASFGFDATDLVVFLSDLWAAFTAK